MSAALPRKLTSPHHDLRYNPTVDESSAIDFAVYAVVATYSGFCCIDLPGIGTPTSSKTDPCQRSDWTQVYAEKFDQDCHRHALEKSKITSKTKSHNRIIA